MLNIEFLYNMYYRNLLQIKKKDDYTVVKIF